MRILPDGLVVRILAFNSRINDGTRLWPSAAGFFFFNDTATTEIYTLSLHDALPILSPSRARELFLNSQCRRDAARPDRAAWAEQRLLAAAATRSATGSASPRPDRTRWLGGLRRAFAPAFRAGSLYPLARGCRRLWRGVNGFGAATLFGAR